MKPYLLESFPFKENEANRSGGNVRKSKWLAWIHRPPLAKRENAYRNTSNNGCPSFEAPFRPGRLCERTTTRIRLSWTRRMLGHLNSGIPVNPERFMLPLRLLYYGEDISWSYKSDQEIEKDPR